MRCPRVAPENPRDRRLIDFPAAVRALPKAELHVHLDGSPRAQTLLDLAWAAKREPIADSPDGLVAALRAGNVFQSLEHYIAAFVQTISLMQTAPALRRIAHELMEDAAREAIHHLEVRFCPDLHTREGLSRDQVLEAVVAGLEEGKRKWELSYGVIVSGLREQGPEASLEMAQLAVAWRDRGVVAFDLAGPETGFPAREHEEAIRLARSAGLHLTLHAGEVTDAEAVREAVDLGTERIGHGV
ncbi:MAG: adenosine deaminase, partial [Myxococcota bacterium]